MLGAMRRLLGVAVLGYFSITTGAYAGPAPRPGGEPIEADNLRLEIRSRGKLGLTFPAMKREELDVTLVLVNQTKTIRSIKQLVARGNRLDDAHGLTYILRFLDGSVLEVEPRYCIGFDDPWAGGKRIAAKPLAIPAEGYALGEFNLGNSLRSDFEKLYKKNEGKFCLTAIVPEIGLQSNTVRYNGCPAPPPKYTPLKHTKFTAEFFKKRDEAARPRVETPAEHLHRLRMKVQQRLIEEAIELERFKEEARREKKGK